MLLCSPLTGDYLATGYPESTEAAHSRYSGGAFEDFMRTVRLSVSPETPETEVFKQVQI